MEITLNNKPNWWDLHPTGYQSYSEVKVFYEQTYNSCTGILRLGKEYGNDRLEAACLRVADSPVVNYGIIANILKKNLDKVITIKDVSPIPPHDQIRGADLYQ